MTNTQRLGGLVIAAALAACGGGSDDPAAAQCRALVDRICDRVVECGFGGLDHETCYDTNEMGLAGGQGCGGADQLGATYDSCMMMLQSATCAELFPTPTMAELPTDCNGVILFEQ